MVPAYTSWDIQHMHTNIITFTDTQRDIMAGLLAKYVHADKRHISNLLDHEKTELAKIATTYLGDDDKKTLTEYPSNSSTILLFRNIPQAWALPATPLSDAPFPPNLPDDWFMAGITAACHETILGTPGNIAHKDWATLREVSYHDPISLHYDPKNATGVMLSCRRNYPDWDVRTSFFSPKEMIHNFEESNQEDVLAQLRKKQFCLQTFHREPFPILITDPNSRLPLISDKITTDTLARLQSEPEGAQALEAFRTYFNTHLISIALQPGEAVLWPNRHIAHGVLHPFKVSSNPHEERWVQRLFMQDVPAPERRL